MKPRICIVGNMLTLPESPDHAGIVQALDKFKESGRISDYLIADVQKSLTFGVDFIVDYIVGFKPDLILHGMTDSLSRELPQALREKLPKALQVMSMWDYRPQNMDYDGLWSTWKKSGPFLDLITLSNKNQIQWWHEEFGKPVIYWPHGCFVQDVQYDESFHFPTVFLGARNEAYPYSERVELLDKINRLVPFKWINEAGGDVDPDRRKVWQNLGKIYYSADTCLDVSHFWDAEGYASGRYFYSSGLGGCCISKRFPGCEELFPEGTKIYFDTAEEAADKLKFYLKNKEARDLVKTKGKAWANKYHNYTVRFNELFAYLKI